MNTSTSIEQTIADFIAMVEVEQSAHTARAYKYALRLFSDHLRKSGVSLSDSPTLLDSRTFEQFPHYLARLHYAKRTLVTYLAGFARYRSWLIANRLITPPDAFEIEQLNDQLRRVRSRNHFRLVRLPERDDAYKIIQAARDIDTPSPRKERDLALALFLFTSGVRAFEAAKLVCKDIDIKKRRGIVIGKKDVEGVIMFSRETAAALEAYWAVRGWAGPNDPVFARHDKGAGKKHKPISTMTVWNVIDQLRELTDIEKGKFSPHWMRHASAMEVQRAGHDVIKTAKHLRHSGLGTVKVYADATDTEMRELHDEVFD